MPGTVIGKVLNLGYAGKVSRNALNKIHARFIKSILDGNSVETQPNIGFGDPVVLNVDNTYSRFGATGAGVSAATAANFAGFAVAEVKQMVVWENAQEGSFTPNQACDVIQQGAITVICKEGTPVAGGPVYLVTAAGTNTAIGDVVATATPAGAGAATIQLSNVKFTTGKVDANSVAEVNILTQVNP